MRSLLADRGAAGIEHPGGTLLAHLDRVGAKLAEWGVRPTLVQAGLCHAFYGTDGFRVALGDLSERELLASVVGAEVEELVYFYCACDRSFSYPGVSSGGLYRDRFTQEVFDDLQGLDPQRPGPAPRGSRADLLGSWHGRAERAGARYLRPECGREP